MIKCEFCGKEYSKKGINTHVWRNHTELGKKFDPNRGFKNGQRKIWNKGLTKETDNRIDKIIKTLKSNIIDGKNNISKKRKFSEEHKKNISIGRIKSIKEGRPKGWNGLNGESYPEKYFEKILINEGLSFEKQHHIFDGDKRNYFIDFYFDNTKIALEIDGKQHKLSERIESDKRRDVYLKNIGIHTFRIEWKDPKKKENRKYFEDKIKELKALFA